MVGSKTNRRPARTKARSSASKQNEKKNAAAVQAAKKKPRQWSKDQSERVRDALNRDADLLYNVLENPPMAPMPTPRTDSVVSLAESMRSLGS